MKTFIVSFGEIQLLDGILIIDSDLSYKTFEKEYFEISVSDKTGNPVNVLIFLNIPFHLPRFWYGSTVTFKAPTIFGLFKEKIVGEIIVFKLFSENIIWKKDIVVINKN